MAEEDAEEEEEVEEEEDVEEEVVEEGTLGRVLGQKKKTSAVSHVWEFLFAVVERSGSQRKLSSLYEIPDTRTYN